MHRPGVHWVSGAEAEAAAAELTAEGWRVFVLQDGLDTKRGFFAAIASTMPLDPPLGGGLKWDALSDSLWEGVSKLPDPRIAIVWPDALTLADADPQTFETALGVLADVCRSLADREATLGAVKEVSVIVGS